MKTYGKCGGIAPLILNPGTTGSGARGGAFGSGTALQAGRSRVRLRFFTGIVLLAAPWPWGRLNLQQK
jgi:hypothetical protein